MGDTPAHVPDADQAGHYDAARGIGELNANTALTATAMAMMAMEATLAWHGMPCPAP